MGDASGKGENEGWWGVVKGAGARILTGESLFMTKFTHQGQGKAKVAFAAPYPGKIIPVDLKEVGGKENQGILLDLCITNTLNPYSIYQR